MTCTPVHAVRLALVALAATICLPAAAQAAVLFSYDAASGQLPTEQGWLAFEIDVDGPLTDANVAGTTDVNANAAIENVDGMNVLHIRDTLTDDPGNLPLYYYVWNAAQQNALINNGLKFTMVFQGLPTTTSGKGNVRFGFNNTEFELQAANIDADKTIEVLGLSAELAPNDGQFHTLVITGDKNGGDYEFSYTFDGGVPTALSIANNPSPGAIESSVYFGASSSGGRGTDILVKSIVMETQRIPEPAGAAHVAAALLGCAMWRRRTNA